MTTDERLEQLEKQITDYQARHRSIEMELMRQRQILNQLLGQIE